MIKDNKMIYLGTQIYPLWMIILSSEFNVQQNQKQHQKNQNKPEITYCQFYYPFMYIFTAGLFQFWGKYVYSKMSTKKRLIIGNIYIFVILICLPRYGGFGCMCFMIFKLAMATSILSHTQLQIYIDLIQQKQDQSQMQLSYQISSLAGFTIISIISAFYLMLSKIGFFYNYRFYFIYNSLFAAFFITQIFFVLWIKKNQISQEFWSQKRDSTYNFMFIDSLISNTFLIFQPNKQNSDLNKKLFRLSEQFSLNSNEKTLVYTNNIQNKYIYDKSSKQFYLFYFSVFIQTFITIFFISPFFIADKLFNKKNQSDQMFDMCIKIIILYLSYLVGIFLKKQFQNINCIQILILSLFKLLILTPLHIFVCLKYEQKIRNKVLPIILVIQIVIYVFSIDFEKIYRNISNDQNIKKEHLKQIVENVCKNGSAGILLGIITQTVFIIIINEEQRNQNL